MSHELVALWLVVVLCLSIPAIVIGFFTSLKYPLLEYLTDPFCAKVFKTGLYLGLMGLCVQTYRSFYYFQHDFYPIDVFFPTWATKDIGYCFIIFSLFLQNKQNKLQ